MKNVCKDCKWWVESKESASVGDCHGGPPTAMQSGTLYVGRFPCTLAFDFCGSFGPKKETED